MTSRFDPARVVAVNTRFAVVALLTVAGACASAWAGVLGAVILIGLLVFDREDACDEADERSSSPSARPPSRRAPTHASTGRPDPR